MPPRPIVITSVVIPRDPNPEPVMNSPNPINPVLAAPPLSPPPPPPPPFGGSDPPATQPNLDITPTTPPSVFPAADSTPTPTPSPSETSSLWSSTYASGTGVKIAAVIDAGLVFLLLVFLGVVIIQWKKRTGALPPAPTEPPVPVPVPIPPPHPPQPRNQDNHDQGPDMDMEKGEFHVVEVDAHSHSYLPSHSYSHFQSHSRSGDKNPSEKTNTPQTIGRSGSGISGGASGRASEQEYDVYKGWLAWASTEKESPMVVTTHDHVEGKSEKESVEHV